ncbi:MAG: hypothetical protein GY862_36195 [Gammaproteobacteria bacterium]|nr:hypothetical protein [Gammaproteobacteria bacterium]
MKNTDRQPLEDFHALYDNGALLSRGGSPPAPPVKSPGHQRLAANVPDVVIDYDDMIQVPVQVAVRQRGVRRAGRATVSPEQAALDWIKQYGDLWNLDADDAAAVEVVAVSRTGLLTVRLIQRVGDREVFNSDVVVALNRQNDVISCTGQFFRGVAVARGAARAIASAPAEKVIAKAAADLTSSNYASDEFAPDVMPPGADPYKHYKHVPNNQAGDQPVFERPTRVKNVMFPLGGSRFTPAYYIELWIKGFPVSAYVLDTEGTPDLLFRKNFTSGAIFKQAARMKRNGIRDISRIPQAPSGLRLLYPCPSQLK